MKLYLTILLSLVFYFCSSQNSVKTIYERRNKNENRNKFINIKFSKLQKNSEKYNKKLVRINGFLDINGKTIVLYPDQNSYEKHDTKHAVIILINIENLYRVKEAINNKNIFIIGIFRIIQHEQFKSALIEIDKIEI